VGRDVITQSDDYFTKGCGRCPRFGTPDCSTHIWAKGLAQLRRMCLSTGLMEHVKWGHPCYMEGGRNIALINAFRDDFRLDFMNAALLKDPHNVLSKAGPSTQTASMMRFSSLSELLRQEHIIIEYLREAVTYARNGQKPARTPASFELPETLVQCLDDDPILSEAFFALTPGRQRSYVIHLHTTKNPATQIARITKAREKIIAGKGALER
jgi:uncharacterized protein YdeI (YjbR/CyaY-like superfamily)